MQTEHDSPNNRLYDTETARQASLRATISRVRLRRRVRKTAGGAAVLLAVGAVVWLAMPGVTPQSGGGPGPVVGPVAVDSLRIRTMPLTAEQRVVTARTPGLIVRTQAGRTVPRLGEGELRALLAAHEAYLIQMDGGTVEVRARRGER